MHYKNPFDIVVDVKIAKNGVLFLDMKRIRLLKAVDENGSINAASKKLGMSYQQAWHFIREMNGISPMPLVIRQRGGTNGGGAILTEFGKQTVGEFEKLVRNFETIGKERENGLWLCPF